MRILRVVIIFLVVAGFARNSYALPIVETAPCINDRAATCAIGVRGLDVLGTVYNVAFSQDAFIDLVSASPHALLGKEALAMISTFFLSSPLNAAGTTISGIVGAPTGPPWSSILIAYGYTDIDVFSWEILYKQYPIQFNPFTSYPVTTSAQFSYHNPSHRTYTAYAVFTESVPVPHALSLVCLGLVGIWVSRRKHLRRAQSQ